MRKLLKTTDAFSSSWSNLGEVCTGTDGHGQAADGVRVLPETFFVDDHETLYHGGQSYYLYVITREMNLLALERVRHLPGCKYSRTLQRQTPHPWKKRKGAAPSPGLRRRKRKVDSLFHFLLARHGGSL